MTVQPSEDIQIQLSVRTFTPNDQPIVSQLYTDGLLAGQIAANDTGADIENIQQAYLDDETSHFWVCESEGRVLGMIGVAMDQEHTAEIRRLRVDPQWQTTPIPAKLLATALEHCNQHGFVKVVLDTRFDSESVLELFEKFGFQHSRTRNVQGKELFEFYLDLYRQPRPEDE